MRQKLSLLMTLIAVIFAGRSFAQCGSGATIDVTESRCEATGTLTASGATGSGNYVYDFVTYPPDYAYSGPSTSNTITALYPGSYTLRIIDAGDNNCFTDYAVTIPGTYVQPLYNPTAVDVTNCYNGTNGEIHGVMQDGRAPFLYEILAGSPCCVGITNTTGDFTNLSPGTYNVRAYDSCGNFQTRQVTIGNFFFSPNSPVVTKTSCNSYSFDAINPNATMSGYTYKVKDANGNTIATGSSLPIAFSHPDATIANAQVCITDACGTDGCVYFTIADWSVTSATTSYTNCNQWTTSSITISGTPPGPIQYGFVRNAGDTVWSSSVPFTFGPQSSPGYWWGFSVVKDACGVVKAGPNPYEQFMLFWGGINGLTYATCNDITMDVAAWHSFVNPVSFSLNGGAPVTDGDNTYTFNNLTAGSYTVVASDVCGNTHSFTYNLGFDWQLNGFSEPYCTLGEYSNYISVGRRMRNPIVYEQWDASYSNMISTQTWTDPNSLNNPWYDASDWYSSMTFSAQPNQTYNYIATDNCGRKDTITIINGATGHVPNTLSVEVVPLCVNKGNINATFTSDNPTWNDIMVGIRNVNTEATFSNTAFTGQSNGTYSWNNLDTGTYQIMIKNRNCSDTTFQTAIVPKYVQPRLRRSIAFSCGAGVVNAIGSTKGGIKPYQYEIFQTIPAGGEQPIQASNLFTITGGPYTLVRMRVIDACGNTSIQDMAVRPPAKPTVKVTQTLPQCNLSNLNIYVDSLYQGANYEWRNPAGSIIATGPVLNIPVTTADTGTYTCRVYIMGSCYDDTTKFKLRLKDFGCYAKLGNYVWNDINKNGVQDGNEVGVAGVTVNLYDGNNVLVGSTVTDAYGYYLFDNLNPGDYRVGFSLPSNYVFSPQDQGGVDAADSDPNISTGLTGLYTLVAGDSNMTVDAGIYLPAPTTASLGNYVWNDLDQDGVQDPNELGVSGVTVTLCDNNGNPIATTVTDANGYYNFSDLDAGTYTVGFSLPIGFIFSPQDQGGDDATDSDVNPATGKANPVTLAAGENNPTIDAGIFAQSPSNAALGNYVWYDVNNNGIQDATENGVAGVVATLYAADGTTVLGTTTTDEFGYYIFNNLTPGNYVVGFTNIPVGYNFSNADLGGDDANDSDPNTTTGKTAVINLSAGEYDMTWDAGIHNPSAPIGALGNYVWYDHNKDGIQDAGENGVPGVIVNLYDAANTFLGTTTTNANGFYIFNNLPAGDYKVEFTNLPPGYKLTSADQGSDDALDSDANPATQMSQVISLATAEVNLTLDAGIVLSNGRNGTASLGDIVWLDANQNGIQDNGEQGVPGVTVTLYAADGTTVLGTKTTDALGNYLFTGLDAGGYVVGFSNIPSGHTFTTANQGTNDALDADADAGTGGKTGVVSLATGEENLTIDAGIFPAPNLASLGNYVWNDLNLDGVQDPNEPGVPGVSATLYDAAGNFVAVTTTDANGFYQFTGLTPGGYYVEFANLPAGFEFTSLDAGTDDAADSDADPVNGSTEVVNLVAGQNYPDLDAGIFTEQAGLGNYVWNDLNNNGIQDPNEEGIPGITVTLYAADGVTPIATAITDANGGYSFVNLDPGTYVVGFSGLPDGANFSSADQGGDDALDSDANTTTGKTPQITLAAGEYNPTIDAGIHIPTGAGLGNYVWFDANNDGLQTSGEPGVPGILVTLYNATGTPIQSAITDENGFYSFPNLTPGTYSVGFSNIPANRGFTSSNSGADNLDNDVDPGSIIFNGDFPTYGSIPAVTLAPGEYNPTLDAGLKLQFPTALTTLELQATLQGLTTKLSWTTVNEKDVQFFTIERSVEGNNYVTIGNQVARGNTNGTTIYKLDDNISDFSKANVIYYRVKGHDIDGQESISNIEAVRPMEVTDPIAVYPIPFKNEISVAYPATESTTITITLTDVLGKVVAQQEFSVVSGSNTITISELGKLATGNYFIKVVSANSSDIFIKKIQKK